MRAGYFNWTNKEKYFNIKSCQVKFIVLCSSMMRNMYNEKFACRSITGIRQHAQRKNIYINYTRNEKAAKHEYGAKTQLDTNPC